MPENSPDDTPAGEPMSEADAADLLMRDEEENLQPIFLDEEEAAPKVAKPPADGWASGPTARDAAATEDRLELRRAAKRAVGVPARLLWIMAALHVGVSLAILSVHLLDAFQLLGPVGPLQDPAAGRVRAYFTYGFAGFGLLQGVFGFLAAGRVRAYRSTLFARFALVMALIPAGWSFVAFVYLGPAFLLVVPLVAAMQGGVGAFAIRAMFYRDTVGMDHLDRGRDVQPETVTALRVDGLLTPPAVGLMVVGLLSALAVVAYTLLWPDPPERAWPNQNARAAYQTGSMIGLATVTAWSLVVLVTGMAAWNRNVRPLVLVGSIIACLPFSLFWLVAFPFGVWSLVGQFDRDATRAYYPRPRGRR